MGHNTYIHSNEIPAFSPDFAQNLHQQVSQLQERAREESGANRRNLSLGRVRLPRVRPARPRSE
jgi:hypothetical protein